MKSIDHRRDVRTIAKFGQDIKLGAKKERIWGKILLESFNKSGENWEVIEHGVDNTGKLILGKLPNYNVDKIFFYKTKNKKILAEIKTIPENLCSFMTFKERSLIECIKNKACIIVPKRYKYYLYKKEACFYLYENYNSKIYWNFKTGRGFSPNDPAVRIYSEHISKLIKSKLIKVYTWGEAARKKIEENWKILSKSPN
jgi:hypothetical protein